LAYTTTYLPRGSEEYYENIFLDNQRNLEVKKTLINLYSTYLRTHYGAGYSFKS